MTAAAETTRPTAGADRRWLSPAALVVLRGNHLCIVGTDDQPDLALDLAALELFCALAAESWLIRCSVFIVR